MKIKLYNTISFKNYKLKLIQNSQVPRFIRRYISIHTSIEFPGNENLMYLSLKNGKIVNGYKPIWKRDPKENENKSTKSHFLEILIKSIQSGVNPVYDRADRSNLHQFQSYTM